MLNLKKIKDNISSGLFRDNVCCFFCTKIKFFVFALFLFLSVSCVYIWYYYAFDYRWSEEKKTEYLKTKNKEVTFDRKKFQDIIEKKQKRTETYKKTIIISQDIFGLKK
jgi:hypothetical protein